MQHDIPTQPAPTTAPVPQVVRTPKETAQCPVVHDAGDDGGKLPAMSHPAVQMHQPPSSDKPWTEPEIPDFDFWYDPLPGDYDPQIGKIRKSMKANLTATVLYLNDLYRRRCFNAARRSEVDFRDRTPLLRRDKGARCQIRRDEWRGHQRA
jgi:hypothetical protein